ncbi:MAG: hypothetical protein U0992_11780 [Planctomycetaceae bacterium]
MILGVLPITHEQLLKVKQYIEANRDYVLEGHQRIEERNARARQFAGSSAKTRGISKESAGLATQRKEQTDARIAR